MLQSSTLSQPPTADSPILAPEPAAHPCLNCGQPLAASYCAACGQKATTHRYSFGHFLAHDLVHGIWHVDNGLLHTVKALFVRPGHRVREYVAGQRVGFFNFFTLLLILLGVGHFLNSYTTVKMADLMGSSGKEMVSSMEAFMEKYPKASLVATIPVYALFSFVWFRKARLNLTEHFVLNSYKTAAESVFTIAFTVLIICYPNRSVLAVFLQLLNLVSAAYAVVFYYQFFSQSGYSRKALVWRSIAVPVTYMLFYVVVGIFAAAFSHKQPAGNKAPARPLQTTKTP